MSTNTNIIELSPTDRRHEVAAVLAKRLARRLGITEQTALLAVAELSQHALSVAQQGLD